MVKAIGRTMVMGRNYGPQITVKRLSTKGKKRQTIFEQIAVQIEPQEGEQLRLPSRAWKVRLIGEGADDAGGVFDETLTEMCEELERSTHGLNLLIPTPNNKADVGSSRDRFMLNPQCTSHLHLQQFRFLGIMFGVAVRTKKPVEIHLAAPVWRAIAGEEPTLADVEELDTHIMSTLRCIDEIDCHGVDDESFNSIIPLDSWEVQSCSGSFIPVVPGGRKIQLTFYNRKEYVHHAAQVRLKECQIQIDAVRRGIARLIPAPLLTMLTGPKLEEMVCGSPEVSVVALKLITRYRDMDESEPVIKWLWEVLEEFESSQRVLFLKFVSGRSRLPVNATDLAQKFQIMKVDKGTVSLISYTVDESVYSRKLRVCRTINLGCL